MNHLKSTVNAKEFADALKKVSVVLRKSSVPQLGQVCVAFREHHCTLTATDLSIWLTTTIPADGDTFSFVFDNYK